MKNTYSRLFILILSLFILGSCSNKPKNDKTITERIQYDVSIRNSDTDTEWWVQNIESGKREKLVRQLFKQVFDGKVKAYEYFGYNLLDLNTLRGMIKQVDTISVESSNPPYELVDTVLVKEIQLKDITKIRFLEEWKMNENTLSFEKKVLGICPLLERYDEKGELRGYRPMFWIFLDNRYPEMLKIAQ